MELERLSDWASALAALATVFAALTASLAAVWQQRKERLLRQVMEDEILSGTALVREVLQTSKKTGDAGDVQDEGLHSGAETVTEVEVENAEAKLLQRYHAQGLAQSSISFYFSIIFAGLGFAIIGLGAFNAYTSDLTWTKGALPIISGTVIDAAAGLIFVQSNKARENMAAFFDRLRADNKLAQALKLADEITDPKVSSNLKAYLAMHFAGIDVSLNSYRSVINLPAWLKEDAAADPLHVRPTPRRKGSKAGETEN